MSVRIVVKQETQQTHFAASRPPNDSHSFPRLDVEGNLVQNPRSRLQIGQQGASKNPFTTHLRITCRQLFDADIAACGPCGRRDARFSPTRFMLDVYVTLDAFQTNIYYKRWILSKSKSRLHLLASTSRLL